MWALICLVLVFLTQNDFLMWSIFTSTDTKFITTIVGARYTTKKSSQEKVIHSVSCISCIGLAVLSESNRMMLCTSSFVCPILLCLYY